VFRKSAAVAMDYFVWAPDLDPRMSDAICGPLRLQGIELSAVPSERSAPDAVIVAWSSRDRLPDRLREQGWADVISPAEVYLADLSEYMSVCGADMDALAALVLLPGRPEDIMVAVHCALRRRDQYMRPPAPRAASSAIDDGLVGPSESLRRTIERACQVAASPGTHVLIEGESGTGKDLIARLIHTRHHGGRKRPFVDVNCAAIPADLLEAELFGFERGAFTEAARDKAGLMELAHGGTLFLDEIGELNIALQAKLLRAIETQSFRRLGGVTNRRAECRVLASTNRNLLDAVQRGLFRLDLYHRLAVMTIEIAPLRERREDILPLAEHFLRTIGSHVNRRVTGLSPAASALLAGYPYPGNVRELRNIIERALILETGRVITPKALGVEVTNRSDTIHGPAVGAEATSVQSTSVQSLEEAERRHIAAALTETGGNRTQAARFLGISVPTLYSKIKKYGFEQVGR
jgi:transcriptional regulator with PAS, ATPase and Fis domain